MKYFIGSSFLGVETGVILDEEDMERIRALPPPRHAPALLHITFAITNAVLMTLLLYSAWVVHQPFSGGDDHDFWVVMLSGLSGGLGAWWFSAWVVKKAMS